MKGDHFCLVVSPKAFNQRFKLAMACPISGRAAPVARDTGFLVPLMLEYEAVLKRPEQLQAGNRTEAMADAFLDALCLLIEPVHLHYLWRPQTRDPGDEMVLETALNGRADALITLNINDFAAAQRFGLKVLVPGPFLRQLQEENTDG